MADQLLQIYAALRAHQWVLLAALAVVLAGDAMKQGWLGTALARVPPAVKPWVMLALTAATAGAGEVAAGKPWQQALADSVAIVMAAVFGHEVIVEGARKGAPVFPPAPWKPQPPAG